MQPSVPVDLWATNCPFCGETYEDCRTDGSCKERRDRADGVAAEVYMARYSLTPGWRPLGAPWVLDEHHVLPGDEPPGEFARIYYMENLNGADWVDVPCPRRWHRCRPQTRGFFATSGYSERCACGGWRPEPYGQWVRRNERKRP